MVDWARIGADMESAATKAALKAKRLTRTAGPMMVQPYHGFVAEGVAHVRARVLEKPLFEPPLEALSLDATLRSNLMRWVVLDMPGVEVTVAIGAASVTAVSDAEGFVVAKVPAAGLEPGWHEATFTAHRNGTAVTTSGRVLQPDPSAPNAVISDIDDTVLMTGMTEGLTSVGRTLFRDVYRRRPVPGTPALYRGLARGAETGPEASFFYVSASPWNLYDMLVQFLVLQGFPEGPLFLTDWRPGRAKPDEPTTSPGHKRARISRLLQAYPDVRFVLVGDSGERDPEIFADFLESHPDRIAAALVRDVGSASEAVHHGEPGMADAIAVADERGHDDGPARSGPPDGSGPAIVCDDTLGLARAARRAGLVDAQAVDDVQAELADTP